MEIADFVARAREWGTAYAAPATCTEVASSGLRGANGAWDPFCGVRLACKADMAEGTVMLLNPDKGSPMAALLWYQDGLDRHEEADADQV